MHDLENKTAVASINELSDLLPKNGKLLVLEHLLNSLNAKGPIDPDNNGQAKLIENLPASRIDQIVTNLKKLKQTQDELVKIQGVEVKIKAFIEKYKITQIGPSQIALTLPKGITRIKFLKEAQALSTLRLKSDLKKDSTDRFPAIESDTLERWEQDYSFSEPIKKTLDLRIDAHVKHSSRKTRSHQENYGWNDVAPRDLAVACVAFFILNNESLLKGFDDRVRAAGGCVLNYSGGLSDLQSYCEDNGSHNNVWASRSLQKDHVAAQYEDFIKKYKISEIAPNQVALTLPKGIKRIEFLKESQALSFSLREFNGKINSNNYTHNSAIVADSLKEWAKYPAFKETTKDSISLRIDGKVNGSRSLTRKQQEDKGWNDVALHDLAVAYTAYYLLTGKDLFTAGEWRFNMVRASDGVLTCGHDDNGLSECYVADELDYSNLWASRHLVTNEVTDVASCDTVSTIELPLAQKWLKKISNDEVS